MSNKVKEQKKSTKEFFFPIFFNKQGPYSQDLKSVLKYRSCRIR